VILSKRQKKGKNVDEKPIEEKVIVHIKNPIDYQGRSFMHPPHDVGVNLKAKEPPTKCFIPKNLIHTYQGHSKGVSAIRWLPNSAHLLLSAGMDARVKVRSFRK
jgi:pre-mRNA-processing factor 17